MNSLNALAHLALLATGAMAYPTSNYSPAAAVGLLKRATVGNNQTYGNGDNGPNLNTAEDRGAWLKDYDINTDWYNEWPNTGVVREVCGHSAPLCIFADSRKLIRYVHDSTG
jgi:hypothetical protein